MERCLNNDICRNLKNLKIGDFYFFDQIWKRQALQNDEDPFKQILEILNRRLGVLNREIVSFRSCVVRAVSLPSEIRSKYLLVAVFPFPLLVPGSFPFSLLGPGSFPFFLPPPPKPPIQL